MEYKTLNRKVGKGALHSQSARADAVAGSASSGQSSVPVFLSLPFVQRVLTADDVQAVNDAIRGKSLRNVATAVWSGSLAGVRSLFLSPAMGNLLAGKKQSFLTAANALAYKVTRDGDVDPASYAAALLILVRGLIVETFRDLEGAVRAGGACHDDTLLRDGGTVDEIFKDPATDTRGQA